MGNGDKCPCFEERLRCDRSIGCSRFPAAAVRKNETWPREACKAQKPLNQTVYAHDCTNCETYRGAILPCRAFAHSFGALNCAKCPTDCRSEPAQAKVVFVGSAFFIDKVCQLQGARRTMKILDSWVKTPGVRTRITYGALLDPLLEERSY